MDMDFTAHFAVIAVHTELVKDTATTELLEIEPDFVLDPPRVEKRNDYIYDEYDLVDDDGNPAPEPSPPHTSKRRRRH